MFSAILAGGENTRFPFTKGFIEIGGRRIVETLVEALGSLGTDQGPLFEGVVISTNEPEKYFYLGVPLAGDVYPARGPLNGLFSVLLATGARDLLVVACDMPFISAGLVKRLARKMQQTGADAVLPVWRGKPEPLFAVYSARSARAMERHLEAGRTGIQQFLNEVEAAYLDEEEVMEADPEGRSFININTPHDLEKVLASL
jgi:molybdopterin-guanine dinucleotide biosynthesis protein A